MHKNTNGSGISKLNLTPWMPVERVLVIAVPSQTPNSMLFIETWASLVAQMVKDLPAKQEI